MARFLAIPAARRPSGYREAEHPHSRAVPGRHKHHHNPGHAQARVIGVELRNVTRLQEASVRTNVVLVTGEQLRFAASDDELLAAHMVPQEVLAPPYARGARGFVDLRAQPLQPTSPGEVQQPPSSTTTVSLPSLRKASTATPAGRIPGTRRGASCTNPRSSF